MPPLCTMRTDEQNNKIMKKLILILICIPTFLFSQGWEKKLAPGTGNSVQQTTDGGFIITGETTYTINSRDIYLIKTDENGDTLWTRTFGGQEPNYGNSVQQTFDGGYIVVGGKDFLSNNADLYVIKTDNTGDILWSQFYGGSYGDMGNSIKQTSDSGYIITGYTDLSTSDNWWDVYLIKTDENGDTVWTRTYGGEYKDEGYSVQQTFDGGFIITGYKWVENKQNDVYILKTDMNGDTLWTRTYGGTGDDRGYSVQQTTDNGYIITGSINLSSTWNKYGIYLLKTDSNGDTLWTKIYNEYGPSAGKSVWQTTDGGYIIAGRGYRYLIGHSDVFLIKTDAIGDTLWTRTFSGTGSASGFSCQQTIDGGFIISGRTRPLMGMVIDSVYLIKTDENGIITFTSELPFINPNRKLVKIVDLSGREISQHRNNQPYIEIYDDGTTKKKMKIK